MLKSYIEGLTVHGLTKVCIGYGSEKLFWSFSLLCASCFIGYICHGNYQTYLKKDVRTETRNVAQSEITLPVFHICADFINYNLYCHNNRSVFKKIHNKHVECLQLYEPKPHCLQYTNNKQSVDIPCGEKRIIPGCISANADGSLKTTASTYINIFIESDLVSVFVDDQKEAQSSKEVILEHSLNLYRESGEYDIILHKRVTERRPYPYPSNCSNGDGIDNFFTKSYSMETCVQSCLLKRLFYKCGTVYDRWKQFVTSDMKVNSSLVSPLSEEQVMSCFRDFELRDKMNITASTCRCPLACNETHISSQITHRDRYFGGYELFIKYYPFEVTHVKEIPEYPIEHFLADIGGLAGLVAGMSVISVLEIIVCLGVALFVKCKCFQ